jgi:hypothetical protein
MVRTFDNKKGDKIMQVIYLYELKNGHGIVFRELQRETGFAFKTLDKWVNRLRDFRKVRRDPRFPIRLTDHTKNRIERDGKCELIIDYRKKKQLRRTHKPIHKIIRGRAASNIKNKLENELKYNKDRVVFHILLLAASPKGVTRYHRPDTELTKYGFDYLILSEPPILRVSSYSSETSQETLVIDNPILREFIIYLSQLLGHLLNRAHLNWQYRRNPYPSEVKWFGFFYDKEIRNTKFNYFYNYLNRQDNNKDRPEITIQEYESKISNYDHLIERTWNDVQSTWNEIQTKHPHLCIKDHIYPKIYELMTDRVYPKFLRRVINKTA